MSATTDTRLNVGRATWLVAEREIRMRLRSKAFLISTGLLLLIVLAAVVIGGIVGANPSLTKLAAVGTAVPVVEQLDGFEVVEADSVEDAEALVRSEEVDAAVVPADGPLGVSIIGYDSAPSSVILSFSVAPEVRLLEQPDQDPFLAYLVALGFGIVFFMSALTFGSTIAQSVVEEKQTRIVEILMSAVPVRVLLAGKILGNSLLAFGQIVLISLLAYAGLLATGQELFLGDIGPALLWFAVFFAFGFVLLAALFAATAALVSRQEDVGSVTSPVTMLVTAPYLLVILFFDNPLVLTIMSYVPFSAPVGMPMRIFLDQAEWWEPLLSLAVLLVSAILVVLVGARIYSNGLLKMGGRVKLKEALGK